MKKNPLLNHQGLAWLLAVLFLMLSTQPAQAHIIHGETGGFRSGFLHPWSGWDHILAMVAVGIWGAQLGAPAIWLLPVVFPMIMSFGGFLGLIGVPIPFGEHSVEYGIALSALLLGIMVCGEVRPKMWIAATMVGFFGLCHGYAHGRELPPGESGLYYSLGFVIATGTLHATGITIGLIHRWPAGQRALRTCGAVIALGGLYFLWAAMHPEPEDAPAGKTSAASSYLTFNNDVAS